jgi:hypothetical protein
MSASISALTGIFAVRTSSAANNRASLVRRAEPLRAEIETFSREFAFALSRFVDDNR